MGIEPMTCRPFFQKILSFFLKRETIPVFLPLVCMKEE